MWNRVDSSEPGHPAYGFGLTVANIRGAGWEAAAVLEAAKSAMRFLADTHNRPALDAEAIGRSNC